MDLKLAGLTYCSDSTSGFFRQSLGKKFNYYDVNGQRITDKKILKRIEGLAIPPAWDRIWICPKASGHLQSTGFDAKKRKQYIYHPGWINLSQQNKFKEMPVFGLSLPKIRSKIKYDLQSRQLEKRKILATLIWLLENTFIRIGNEEYSKENDSFGLTTLRNKHVKIVGSELIFQFKGKSGVFHSLRIKNPTIVKTIKKCVELPGYELFQFIDEKGNRHVIDSTDVNLFLKEVTKKDFSAKDFRTWGGTYLSSNHFYKLGVPENKKLLKQNIVETVRQVSKHLNNTVSVCKNYYIHPSVIQTYEENVLIPHFKIHQNQDIKKPGLSWNEYALIRLLQKYPYISS